jgi:uncharacterized membrane protein
MKPCDRARRSTRRSATLSGAVTLAATALLSLASGTIAAQPARHRHSGGVDARVIGTFEMLARVTVAVNVRGERPGEILHRRWTIVPERCSGSVCELLSVERQRSDHRHSRLTLHRVGRGYYKGRGVFYAALRCEGRVYRHGSRVPYVITLRVRKTTIINGVRFATRVTASYINRFRSDSTPCPLGPSYDSGHYTGTTDIGPPRASFTAAEHGATATFSFTDTSTRGAGNARIVRWSWDFGDPRSGTQNYSTLENPTHTFTAPGTYTVTLGVADANGLTSLISQTVTDP